MRWREIQDGGGGWLGPVARLSLDVLAGGWRLAWHARRALYGTGLRRTRRLPVPVLSVGNLAVGGTGKTPLTVWLARRLLAAGRHPGVLSRGYGPLAADGSGLSDEGAVLRASLGPAVPYREDPDRFRGGRRLLEAHPDVEVLLLDDGFQHWALHRDRDLVLVDGTDPFGGGRLLPRGRLREPRRALGRADLLVVTRAERLGPADLDRLERALHAFSDAPVAAVATRPAALEIEGGRHPPAWLEGRRVYLWCGIGNPAAFEALAKDLGAVVRGRRFARDHAVPRAGEITALRDAAAAAGADWILTTRKDAVKLTALPSDLAVLDVDVEVVRGEEHFARLP